MNSADYRYFRGRALDEDWAAHKAQCIEARICHQQLADAYRNRCAEILRENMASARRVAPGSAEIPHPSGRGRQTAFGFAPEGASRRERSQLVAS